MTVRRFKRYGAAFAVFLVLAFSGIAESYSPPPSTYAHEGNFVIWSIEGVAVWRFPKSRAADAYELSDRFNRLFKAGFELEDLQVEKSGGAWSLKIGKNSLYAVPADYAASIKQDAQKIALQMMSRLYEALGSRFAGKLTSDYQIRGKYDISAAVSWYGGKFIGKKFANGERFTDTHLTAAAKSLPFGTLVKLITPSGKYVVVRVTDRFKEHKNRVLDISHAAAELLGIKNAGTAAARIKVIGKVDRVGGK